MNMEFKRKLPTPQTIRDMYPVSPELARQKQANDRAVRDVLTGEDDRLMLLIGPCSADREDAVLDYVTRLRGLQEKVKDKILLVPRVYSNKPRTTGDGYKGMLHQPDPNGELAHRGVGAPRRAQDSIVLTATAQIHASLHGAAVPRGIAVLVGQRATRAGGQAIEHIADEAAPGGLAALVRGGDDVQTRLQVQRGVAQPPEIGLHMADLQDGHLLIYSRNVLDIITQNPRLVTIGTERKFFEKI